MPRSDRTNERTNDEHDDDDDDSIHQPGHVHPAFIMHASLLCIARTSKRMYFGFMANRWDTHDPSRDTGYFSPGTSLSTLARNKGRYSSPVLRSCIAAREIARDELKPRSFTIHIAGSIWLSLLSCVDRKLKKGKHSETLSPIFPLSAAREDILNKIARSFAPSLDHPRKFSTIYSTTFLKKVFSIISTYSLRFSKIRVWSSKRCAFHHHIFVWRK